jgi:hypothetical protein
LLNEVANKYKSFEVPQKNGTTRNVSIPVTWSKDSRNYMLSHISFRPVLKLMNRDCKHFLDEIKSQVLYYTGENILCSLYVYFLNKVLE